MYDPTYSTTFASIMQNANVDDPADMDWSSHLRAATELMDDGIRESLAARDWSACRNGDLEFLLTYMAEHEKRFGTRFEWS